MKKFYHRRSNKKPLLLTDLTYRVASKIYLKDIQIPNRNVVGIIPTINSQNFDLPWQDAVMPLGPDVLLIEWAVYDCVYAGCSSIWVVCGEETTPIIRDRIGEWVEDPWYSMKVGKRYGEKKDIPIYYINAIKGDDTRTGGLLHRCLYAASQIRKISRSISNFMIPDYYYFKFPTGIYDLHEIKLKVKPFIVRRKDQILKDIYYITGPNDKGVFSKEPKHLGVFINNRALRELVGAFYVLSDGRRYSKRENYRKTKHLTKKERFQEAMKSRVNGSYAKVNLQEFNDIFVNYSSKSLQLDWAFDVSNWEGYRAFMGSEYADVPARYSQEIFTYSPYTRKVIGVDLTSAEIEQLEANKKVCFNTNIVDPYPKRELKF